MPSSKDSKPIIKWTVCGEQEQEVFLLQRGHIRNIKYFWECFYKLHSELQLYYQLHKMYKLWSLRIIFDIKSYVGVIQILYALFRCTFKIIRVFEKCLTPIAFIWLFRNPSSRTESPSTRCTFKGTDPFVPAPAGAVWDILETSYWIWNWPVQSHI